MDFLPIVFSVVLVVLTIVLSVVGVQVILTLSELRRTLRKVNDTIDDVDRRIDMVVTPLQSIASVSNAVKAGSKFLEVFVNIMQKKNDKPKSK